MYLVVNLAGLIRDVHAGAQISRPVLEVIIVGGVDAEALQELASAGRVLHLGLHCAALERGRAELAVLVMAIRHGEVLDEGRLATCWRTSLRSAQ